MTVFTFGVYALCLASALMIAPNVLLSLVRVASTSEVWIRVVGMLLLFLGTYYILAARSELAQFFRWTVWMRMCVVAIFGVFVVLGLGPPVLLLFGMVDFAMAAWTWVAIRKVASPGVN